MPGQFETVVLETECGIIVAYVEMPRFAAPPKVLVWECRVFQLHSQASENIMAVYREVFAYPVMYWKGRMEDEADLTGGHPKGSEG